MNVSWRQAITVAECRGLEHGGLRNVRNRKEVIQHEGAWIYGEGIAILFDELLC